MQKKIIRIILVLVMVVIVAFYIYDIAVLNTAPTEHLFRTISIICLCVAGLIRSSAGQGRRSLALCEQQYAEFVDVFTDQPFWRKKLLCALRLFDEGNYRKALKYLSDLKDRCHTKQDAYTVWLFSALCFTEIGMPNQAARLYEQMIFSDAADSRVYSNLGNLQNQLGQVSEAIENLKIAIEYDVKNSFAYNNLASVYFDICDFENAILYANKSLELNAKTYQASSLLAIIYSILEDKENAEKYFHMAVSSGQEPQGLKKAIEHYRAGDEI